MEQANACMERGEYDRSVAHCSEAIRADPKLVEAYTTRAFACLQLGDWPRVVDDLTRAIPLTAGDDSRAMA
jgi:tetratricopeptide (TPR) repeat protein